MITKDHIVYRRERGLKGYTNCTSGRKPCVELEFNVRSSIILTDKLDDNEMVLLYMSGLQLLLFDAQVALKGLHYPVLYV